ncbi:MAG: WecB/TagA/CpsF family glycosyltransferase [Caldiserica bacterium]|nr:WecB/TagA/CpsF family glycosyltransferase [Caldisericota bacterium]
MKVSEFLKSLNWCLTSTEDAAKFALSLLDKPGQHYIITTNMEIMGQAMHHPDVAKICQDAKLHVPDGIGALKILRKFGFKPEDRITGVDLGPKILELAPAGTKVFFFGAPRGVADSAMARFAEIYKNIDFVGADHGYDVSDKELFAKINTSGATILYVALGVPKQERWTAKNLPNMPGIKLAMGVGGSFQCWADPKARTPAWIQKMNLEWAHRVLREPAVRIPRFWKTLKNFLPMYFLGK